MGGGDAILTSTNSFLLSGVSPLCQIWWKSTKKCDRQSAHTWTDGRTDSNWSQRRGGESIVIDDSSFLWASSRSFSSAPKFGMFYEPYPVFT